MFALLLHYAPYIETLGLKEFWRQNGSGEKRLMLGLHYSTAAKGYDCAFCDKSTNIGTLVVLYI